MKQWIEDLFAVVCLLTACYIILMWGYILEGAL